MNGWAVMVREGVVAGVRYIGGDQPVLLEGEYFHPDSDGPPPQTQVPPSVAQKAAIEAITIERDRRIDSGFTFQGKLFQSRAADRENIAGAAQLGFVALVNGAQAGDLRWSDPDKDFAWISSDNNLVPMDAQTVVEFGRVAVAHKQSLIFAARSVKDMTPTPADYKDDKYWS